MKLNFNIFKQALCTILIVHGMTMYSQVHVENAENVVVYNENNVHFFGKNTIKTESGVIELSENVKSKLVRRIHQNKEMEMISSLKIDSSQLKFSAKNTKRKGSLEERKEEKVNLSSNKLKLVTKYTQKQSRVASSLLVKSSRLCLYKSEEKSYYSFGKYNVNNTKSTKVGSEEEQNKTPSVDFVEENKPFLNLHNVSFDEIPLNPSKKNLKLENTLVVIYGKRGPPIFSLV